MIKSLFMIPISVFLLGIGNKAISTKASNPYPDEVEVSKYKNKAYQKYKTTAFKEFEIDPFSYSVASLKKGTPLRVKFWRVDHYDYGFYFSTYDENNKLIETISNRHNTDAYNFTKDFKFTSKTYNHEGEVTFKFKISGLLETWTVATFALMPKGATLTWDNPIAISRSEVTCYPNSGYSEVFGDVIQIKNLKEVYEIPTYLRFTFNDLKLRVYTEMVNYSNLEGKANMIVPKPSNFASLPQEQKDLYKVYDNSSYTGISWAENNGVGFTLQNNREYYVDKSNNHIVSSYTEGYEPTTDYYLPKEFYEDLKESTWYVELTNFGKYDLTYRIEINVEFTGKVNNTIFDVVGEMGESEIDDEIEDYELEGVDLP